MVRRSLRGGSKMRSEHPMREHLLVLHNDGMLALAWPRRRRCVFCGAEFAAEELHERACTNSTCREQDMLKRHDEADELYRLGLLNSPGARCAPRVLRVRQSANAP